MTTTTLEQKNVAVQSKDRKSAAGNPSDRKDHGFAASLMQYLVVPAFVLDVHGRVMIWNKACERLTGMDADEVAGTREHWQAFYDEPRPCLSDLIVQNRAEDMGALYAEHERSNNVQHGLRAENWCVMPRLDAQRYLYADAGPIFDTDGRLLAVVQTLRDMTVQKNAQLALERLAVHDGMTGILNRRGFDHALQVAWGSAARSNTSIALIMVDADYFKRFNDTYGHQAGDECLKWFAKLLEEVVLRPTDVVARYGGEKFAVILASADENGAQRVAARIVEAVSALGIAHLGGIGGVVTVSVGAASVIPDTNKSPHGLIGLADRSLYQAKQMGRNQVALNVH